MLTPLGVRHTFAASIPRTTPAAPQAAGGSRDQPFSGLFVAPAGLPGMLIARKSLGGSVAGKDRTNQNAVGYL